MAGKQAKRTRMRHRQRTLSNRRRRSSRSLRLEPLEARQLMAADLMHNAIRPADVNDDGLVNTLDALMAVDRLRQRGGPVGQGGFFDINGDGQFNVADPLTAVDSLRRARRGPRAPAETDVRSITGEGNNEVNAEWGQAGQDYLRLVESNYADGASAPAGEDLPSAREISTTVFQQDELVENENGLSDLFWQWGQFLDHDLDLTNHVEPTEEFSIDVPEGDAWFDPFGTGDVEISLSRSLYNHDTGVTDARQQINSITAFIDGSNIYGSDEERAAELRTFEGGRLATSDGDLLPFNEAGLENAGGASDTLFLAGDVRANEQAGLTAMHTVWVREHNRIADRIAAENPDLDDEQIYQRARTMVIAELQAITYNEFLPALLGEGSIERYDGYDENVNPGISNIFATAAYRFGHSMLSPELLRLDENGEIAEEGNLALRDAFFSPDEITEHGVDSLLRGLAANTAQEIDAQVVDDVRNFLFGPPGAGGFDLAALNIQRGREHGLPGFNDVREQLGMERAESFADITSDPETQASLEEAYGDVDSVEAWVGMLAEDHADGAAIGETAAAVLVDQFERLRDGDRFWYQRTLSGEQLRQVERTTLADVIERNTNIDALQQNVFFAPDAQPDPPTDPTGGGGRPGSGGDPGQGGGQNRPGQGERRDGFNGPGGQGEAPVDQRPGERRERGGPERRDPAPPGLFADNDSLLDDLLLPPLDSSLVDRLFAGGDV